jgi:phospholipid/cholesterol/gamma-HCH transport system substrate-binding protein
MRRFNVEFSVGLFFILGLLCIVYLSVRITKVNFSAQNGYLLRAEFENVGGLKKGTNVEIAGVPVGTVEKISLQNYKAVVSMQIGKHINIPEDTIASIKTKGLLGEKFVELSPGGSETCIKPGGSIQDTQAPLDFEEVLGKYVFGKI